MRLGDAARTPLENHPFGQCRSWVVSIFLESALDDRFFLTSRGRVSRFGLDKPERRVDSFYGYGLEMRKTIITWLVNASVAAFAAGALNIPFKKINEQE